MPDTSPRNVVLIILDDVRKDYFDDYAPRLQELADISVQECRTASSWSLPSHASMLTGELPHRHGAHAHSQSFAPISTTDVVTDDLQSHTSISISANRWLSQDTEFDEFFDRCIKINPNIRFPEATNFDTADYKRSKFLNYLVESCRSDRPVKSLTNAGYHVFNELSERVPLPRLFDDGCTVTTRESIRQLEGVDEPVFLLSNFIEAHGPHTPILSYDSSLYSASNRWKSNQIGESWWEMCGPDPSAEHRTHIQNYRDLYTAGIEYLDRKLERFIHQFQLLTELETTFIVTADHGENLGFKSDNYYHGHVSALNESLLHVPFLIMNPPTDFELGTGRYLSQLQFPELIKRIAHDEGTPTRSDQIKAERIGTVRADEAWDGRAIRCIYNDNVKYEWDSLGTTKSIRIKDDEKDQETVRSEDIHVPEWALEAFEVGINEAKRNAEMSESAIEEFSDSTKAQLADLGYLG